MQTRPTHYEILGIPVDANEAVIKSAYKKLALIWHPDKSFTRSLTPEQAEDAVAVWKRINEAHEVLVSAAKRRQYDANRQQPYHEDAVDKKRNDEFCERWEKLKDLVILFNLKSELADNPDSFLEKIVEEKKEMERLKAELAEQKKLVVDLTKKSFVQGKQIEGYEQSEAAHEIEMKELAAQNKKLSDELKSKGATLPPKSTAPQPSVGTAPSLFSPASTSGKFSCPGLIGIKILVYDLGTSSASVRRLELVFARKNSAAELRNFFRRLKPYSSPADYVVHELYDIKPEERLDCFEERDLYYCTFEFNRDAKSEAYLASQSQGGKYAAYILLRELEKFVDGVTSLPKAYWDPWEKGARKQVPESRLPPELQPSSIDKKAGLKYSQW